MTVHDKKEREKFTKLMKKSILHRWKYPAACTRITSRSITALATLLFITFFNSLLSPQSAVLEDKELSFALASTDIPPFSVAETLRSAIYRAQKSITIAIYALQDRTIVSALRTAAEKNKVKITIVTDPSATENASFLLGPSIDVHERPLTGLMHVKLMIIDAVEVWYGTMNFTKSSLTLHGNMACGVRSPLLAQLTETYVKSLIDRTPYTLPITTLHTSEENSPCLLFAVHPHNAKQSFKELISRIDRAKERVFVAMYTFTHQEIAQSLIRAHKRGVDVRVMFDKDSSQETSKKVYALLAKNQVPVGTRKRKGLLHYKCALIDSSFVIGSCNWTKAAFTINAETFSIIDTMPQQLQDFLVRWWNTVESDSNFSTSNSPTPLANLSLTYSGAYTTV